MEARSVDQQFIDTLQLSAQQLTEVMAFLDERTGAAPFTINRRTDRRSNVRIAYREQAVLICRLQYEVGPPIRFVVKCRDISTTGIGFIHGRFVHPKTKVNVTMITSDRRGFEFSGKIVRCEHIHNKVHEVGVAFDIPIDLSEVLPPDPSS